jgi:hypothetical protein
MNPLTELKLSVNLNFPKFKPILPAMFYSKTAILINFSRIIYISSFTFSTHRIMLKICLKKDHSCTQRFPLE